MDSAADFADGGEGDAYVVMPRDEGGDCGGQEQRGGAAEADDLDAALEGLAGRLEFAGDGLQGVAGAAESGKDLLEGCGGLAAVAAAVEKFDAEGLFDLEDGAGDGGLGYTQFDGGCGEGGGGLEGEEDVDLLRAEEADGHWFYEYYAWNVRGP